MGIITDRWAKRTAELLNDELNKRNYESGDTLVLTNIEKVFKSTDGIKEVNIKEVLSLPAVQYCLDLIGGTIAGLPIRLYNKKTKKEITDDKRTFLLNEDTGDTLTSTQFWKALIIDYYFGKNGGYAYIGRKNGVIDSLHYIDNMKMSIWKKNSAIDKSYTVLVDGIRYQPYKFFKFMRRTKDGCTNISLLDENNLMFALGYYSYSYLNRSMQTGGNKKGFFQTEKTLSQENLNTLKSAYSKFIQPDGDNGMVLNNGIQFQPTSSSPTELQLSEIMNNINSGICNLFGIYMSDGSQQSEEVNEKRHIKTITRVIQDIEKSLNRDLLLEKEKEELYFAFDTRELTRGNLLERYQAYQVALNSNIMQIDEVRDLEDLEPLGVDWITLGLDKVLYNPKTKEIYTPNTKEKTMLDTGEMMTNGIEKGSEKNEDNNAS